VGGRIEPGHERESKACGKVSRPHGSEKRVSFCSPEIAGLPNSVAWSVFAALPFLQQN